MLSKVILNHKIVELNSFSFKLVYKIHLKSENSIISNIISAFIKKYKLLVGK
jgi:hypothetical protein